MDRAQQQMFDMAVRQGMGAVTSDESAKAVAKAAKVAGPARAIADAVDQTLEGISMAAGNSGIQLPQEVVTAAAQTMVMAMSSMMAEAGGTDDPEALASEVMQILASEGAEDDEGGEEPPEPMAEDGAPSPGALGAVRTGGVM